MTERLSLLLSQCRGHEFHLWLGNKDPCRMVQLTHTHTQTHTQDGEKTLLSRLAGCIYQADPPKKTQPTKQTPNNQQWRTRDGEDALQEVSSHLWVPGPKSRDADSAAALC